MARINFDSWVNQTYNSPLEILLDCLASLQSKAAECNASIDAKTLSSLTQSHFLNRKSFYLKNRRGVSDSKQYARIVMGQTGDKTLIPIVLFKSYSSKHGHDSTFSPASHLWGRYKRHSGSPSSNSVSGDNNYQKASTTSDSELALLQDEQDALDRSANQAAALAIQKIEKHSQLCSRLPSIFEGHNIPDTALGFCRIVSDNVQARLYSRTKGQWVTITIARPRDIVVPIYDLETGEVSNIQIIPANTSQNKNFLAGAKFMGLTSLIINTSQSDWQSNDWVVCEGFKTGCAIAALESANIAPALSANNVPNVVALLKALYPSSNVYVANDNDDDGTKYRRKAVELGALAVLEPDLYPGADWADVTKHIGLHRAIDKWEQHKHVMQIQ